MWDFIYKGAWVLLAVMAVICVVALFWTPFERYQELQRKEAQLTEENRLDAELLKSLREKQDRLRTDPRFVERIAREELGLAKPGETIFKFVDDGAAPAPVKR